MNSKGKLSQRESTVNSNLEEAAKERGIPYVSGNYSFQSYSELRVFLATPSENCFSQYISAKTPEIKQATKRQRDAVIFD